MEFLLESRLDGNGVHDSVNSHACQRHTFFERDAQFVESLHQFGVNLLFAFVLGFGGGVGVVGDGLIVYFGQVDMGPRRLFKGLPITESAQPKFQKPFRFTLLLRNQSYDIFVESALNDFGVHIGREAVFIGFGYGLVCLLVFDGGGGEF